MIHGDMKENLSGCFFSEHSVYENPEKANNTKHSNTTTAGQLLSLGEVRLMYLVY